MHFDRMWWVILQAVAPMQRGVKMLLNLAIIGDELAGYGCVAPRALSSHRTLAGVRLLHDGAAINPEYVYVTEEKSLSCALKHASRNPPNPLRLIYIGAEEELRPLLAHHAIEALVVGARWNPSDVFDATLAAFERLTSWERSVYESIATMQPLQRTLDLCATVLANPLALFDSSMALVLAAGNIPKDPTGSIWEDVLSLGYTRDSKLSLPERRDDERHWEQSRKPYLFHVAAYPNENELVAILRNQGDVLGSLGSVDCLSPFTQGQISLYAVVRDLMEVAIVARGQASVMDEGMSASILRLLEGTAEDDTTADRVLEERGWRRDGTFVACYVERSDGGALPDYVADRAMKNVIASVQAAAYAVRFANGFAVLFCDPDGLAKAGDADALNAILEPLDLICGSSLPVQGLVGLHVAIQQACLTVRFAPRGPAQRIYRFADSYARILLGILGEGRRLDELCDPSVLALSRAGGGEERVRTLLTYLVRGKNVSDTSRALHVHRNTLVYRLGRLEEELGRSLDDLDENGLLTFLVSCLVALG